MQPNVDKKYSHLVPIVISLVLNIRKFLPLITLHIHMYVSNNISNALVRY